MPPLSPVYLLRKLLGNERWRQHHVRASVWAALGLVLVMLVGSWIIVPFEAPAHRATITSFPLALWWSVETATTVGYGDLYPVTTAGRVIAGIVMLVGISVFSIVTASLATWFVGSAAHRARQVARAVEHAGARGRADADQELRALHARFDRLEDLIGGEGGAGPGVRR
ncbi:MULTISPECIES: potassium channel family protein [unclassified Streptomyces]|uniref:potassium channel family protein n=1 Tax=Streptomyces TaxID=1883 RepID=UPI0001C18BEC|nr:MULTISPECIES: potassium channel family protein [unclassified Streptomyces]AEN13753.1 Ion transport 2 domain protein [Streptomyces sp. SirexAA-E]MYR64583.1 voltage-gated potassium channel [Streptomyces sp. SID4939]MYR99229.1 voltage-gated potassium channel [Streptomyces sp. SID4940]MYT67640.1 voltage-gated potassium channel [Streptomyces sp. SID8357]MYT86484.1 voltage-gated potassium channel [Streptomyces sp. SID8360]